MSAPLTIKEREGAPTVPDMTALFESHLWIGFAIGLRCADRLDKESGCSQNLIARGAKGVVDWSA